MQALVVSLVGIVSAVLFADAAAATTTFVDWEFDRTAWEAAVGAVAEDSFDNDVAQSTVLDFDSGIQSVASGANGSPSHYVDGTLGRFVGTLRTFASTAPGYLVFVWTFPEPVTYFGADFYSIGGSREVSVQGTFDSGLEAFDLRTLFIADGGLDQGFFGVVSSEPFASITLIALGSIDSNDAFNVDNVAFELPEPVNPGTPALIVLALLARRRQARPRRDDSGASGPGSER
jgi:hypothetical protein